MKPILALLALAAFTANSLAGELQELFHKERSSLEKIRDEFSTVLEVYPDLNHVDLQSYSPRSIAISPKDFESIRSMMEVSGVLSVMKGDFSGMDFEDTVYILIEYEDHPDIGIQRGFVSTKNELGESGKSEDIRFTPIDQNWYLYERKFEHELY
ncbi:hypothetical protein [Pelagicoccus sp. SDUM812003]|uniref:hypothetical protein n=1 Tax=Pelagicoccus sp. SDUM812003 TaxID=3041267 RepID=UPI00280EC2C0|nr:hypothetical protein [Pelagicoccus sp. SDUM812003]MDQ8205785.1 hypothetical protein [Pelagicoccus sp. SDUM812003]